MPQWVITYQHRSADGRTTASVAIVPHDTPQGAEAVAERLHKDRGYQLLNITRFKEA